MISPQYVDGLELRIEELASELRSHKATLEGLQQERDALAALCGAAAVVLERTANDTLDGRNMVRRLRGATDTSIARLKAEWQAKGAQLTADSIRYEYEGEIHQDRIADHADEVAAELRRQAEEDA